jgi:DNA invertase Pin-like site-specific DNA recombinase
VKTKRAALYVRVSTNEQDTGAQERALREYVQRRGWKLQKIYRDHGLSGASSKRPALNELLKACRRGSVDVVVVWKFDRFARSLNALISGLEMCRALGIDFVSVTESADTSLPAGELVFQMIGAVAQFERSLIAERVKSGLANARANGKVLGRPPMRRMRHLSIREQANILNPMLRGHYAYYGIAGNIRALQRAHRVVERYWRILLSSRSWQGQVLWKQFQQIKDRFPLVRPKLYLPYSELQAIAVL